MAQQSDALTAALTSHQAEEGDFADIFSVFSRIASSILRISDKILCGVVLDVCRAQLAASDEFIAPFLQKLLPFAVLEAFPARPLCVWLVSGSRCRLLVGCLFHSHSGKLELS